MSDNSTDISPKCSLCEGSTRLAFRHAVLRKVEATYQQCCNCGFISAHPANWLGEAYASALASTDTGAVRRNEFIVRPITVFAWMAGLARCRGLDAGGAHGLLVRMLRDRGLDFRWSDKYARNIFARGFEDDGGAYEWITLIEVFEHLVNPLEFLNDLVDRYHPRCVLLTTELLPDDRIPSENWWYWSFDTGQHIGFATRRSLQCIAERLGYELESVGPMHLFTKKKSDRLAFRWATGRVGRHFLSRLALHRIGSLTQKDFETMSSR